MRILVAEDNPGDVRLIQEGLRQYDVASELFVLSDFEKVDAYVASFSGPDSFKPDLILLDLNMPKGDGQDILRRIKETPDLRNVPVVVLSSSQSPLDRDQANSLGAYEFVQKATNLDEFLMIGALAKKFAQSA